MRDYNFSSGDEEGEKAKSGYPVSDADERRVALSNRRGWDGRDRTRGASGLAHSGMVSRAANIGDAGRLLRNLVKTFWSALADDFRAEKGHSSRQFLNLCTPEDHPQGGKLV